jgi:hypothetical protein
VRLVLREFYVDDAGVPRAQAAQFLANGTGIVWAIEPYLPLTISGPPAIPAGIPTGDASVLDRSVMQYGITHSLLLPRQTPNSGLSQIVGIEPNRD